MSRAFRPGSSRRAAIRGGAVLACALALAACGGRGASVPTLLGETFAYDEMYSQEFDTSPALACEAARRALLGQGYVVAQADAGGVEASKDFQPESDVHARLVVRVSCVDQGTDDALVFATALQESYVLRKSPNSVNLGASALGSLSVPIGMREDSLVRVASRTVQDTEFYQGLFKRVEAYLPSLPIQRRPGASRTQAHQQLPYLHPAQAPTGESSE